MLTNAPGSFRLDFDFTLIIEESVKVADVAFSDTS
jgi:hypothetical protein